MTDNYTELMRAAQLLRSVKVDGEHWLTMHACCNSILQVAEAIKNGNDEEVDA